MNAEQLKEIFEKEFNLDTWIQVLRENLNVNIIHNLPISIPLKQNLFEAKAFELGQLNTKDDQLIGVYKIDVPKVKQLHRNKVGLRDLLKDVYKNDVDAALVVFVQDKKWRFSYISEVTIRNKETGKRESIKTDPKRYTYLLGEGEKAKTAADRFSGIQRTEDLFGEGVTLKALDKAFSVERMSKDFFNDYRKHYGKFLIELIGEDENRRTIKDPSNQFIHAFKGNDKETKARDFIKRLLGRLVFLYFLEKKGWLGVPIEKEWGSGNENFLSDLFNDCKFKDNFYNFVLIDLFFKNLNKERDGDFFDVDPSVFFKTEYNKLKIPFLNGGLFEDEDIETNNLVFQSYLFADLFNFFDQYNFTVYEDSPNEHIVAVDPEMLGHIFENLLEDNKDKGAFYTPKEIVHYMCQESLIEYLCTELRDTENLRYKIESFIKKQEVSELANIEDRILIALKNVKICDPAIGSGAFPMGILLEIHHAVENLFHAVPNNVERIWEIDDWEPAKVKLSIIQNSIYGVDLEPGAVDIARLRFWLSLVVDEDKPQPLPNLDYKIMQGDSLLERFEDIDLSVKIEENKKLFRDPEKFSIEDVRVLKLKQKSYFGAKNPTMKGKLQLEINSIITKFLNEKINSKKKKNDDEQAELIDKLSLENSRNPNNEASKRAKVISIDKLTKQLKTVLNTSESLENIKNEVLKIQKTKVYPYFLWHLWFADVFEDGGFDIVIGNPPYIQFQKIKEEANRVEKVGYKTFTKTGDIYSVFYEQGNNLLKNEGLLCYITSNTWMRTKSGELLRRYFIENTNPIKLLNFEDTKIFQTATVETNIILTKKEENRHFLQAVAVKMDFNTDLTIGDYLKQNLIILNDLNSEGWVILNKDDYEIKQIIAEKGKKLSEWNVEFYRGFLTGFNDAFFINKVEKDALIAEDPKSAEIIKPLLRGREIRKFGFDFHDQFVIFSHNGIKGNLKKGQKGIPRINVPEDFPAIYNRLKLFKDKSSPLAKKNNDGTWQTLIDRSDQGIHWTNLRDCAYFNLFDKPKLIWLSITDKPAFSYNENHYVTAPAYFLSGEKLKFLLPFLNSKVMEWYLDKVSSSTGQGTNQWSKIFVEQLPIPEVEDSLTIEKFETFANYLTFLNDFTKPTVNPYTENDKIASVFEEVLNMMVYEVYFKNHMEDEEIDVLKFINKEIFKPISEHEEENSDSIATAYKWLQQNDNAIRNRILLSNIRSPHIIKRINSTTH
ncbi:MAG: Eco57I restriction-modification methylase domain-containing protein [Flavobacterium sp.]|nr:Eco57I restriction-modification methylase domain-containing protein [Flavobacterium sp.]